jgi:hypothetical protein
LAYFSLSVIPYWHFWAAGGTRIAGKGGDAAVDAWFLDWVSYSLIHVHNPLLTDWGNFPFGVNGVTNVSTPLLGILGMPVTLTFGAFATTMLFFTIAFPLSSLSAYMLLRHWVRWCPAAFTGGLLYGFSPYLTAQGLGHLNLVFVPLPPLIFLVLCHITSPQRRRSWAWGAALAMLCTAQFFISSEVLASTAIIGGTGLLAAAAVNPVAARDRWKFTASAIGSASVIMIFLLSYPLWLLAAGPDRTSGPAQETDLYRGNLLAPVIPDSSMHFRFAEFLRLADTFSGNTSENGLYIGIPLLVALIAGVIACRRRPIMKVVALTTAAAFILALGSRLTVARYVWKAVPLPEAALTRIPFLNNTIAARYSLYVMLGAALILALTLQALRDRIYTRDHRSALAAGIACSALACLALVPLIPAWPYTAHVTQAPRYFSSNAAEAIPNNSVGVTYPFPTSADPIPMLWQVAASLRFKSPGGRFVIPAPGSAGTPPSDQQTLIGQIFIKLYSGHRSTLTPALRSALLAELRSWNVRAVLVQPAGERPALVMPFFEWLLGRQPDVRAGGISAWYGQVETAAAPGFPRGAGALYCTSST